MNEKRRALGRGLGALIPTGLPGHPARPVDVFFAERSHQNGASSEHGSSDAEPAEGSGGWISRSSPGAQGFTGNGAAAAAGGTAERALRETTTTTDTITDLPPVAGARFAELPIGAIRPNPRQPRSVFDDDELAELAHSIREIGVLQPVVVRSVPASPHDAASEQPAGPGQQSGAGAPGARSGFGEGVSYELVMGERRLRATQLAGLSTIPAIIKDTQDDDLLRDALLENLHRTQLNALEEAAAYQQLLDDFGCTHEQLASRLGRSRPQISNTIRLLRLPPAVARRVAAGVLSAGHARALLSLPSGADMELLAQRAVAEGLSVRTLEEIATTGGAPALGARRPRAGTHHPALDDLATVLADRLDTRVSMSLGQRKGRLSVEFASLEDLHRILALLGMPTSLPFPAPTHGTEQPAEGDDGSQNGRPAGPSAAAQPADEAPEGEEPGVPAYG